tara:strand:- start:2358 stop:2540 length:183 start_codon:yes stop_codon:yes gene_type:complete
MEVMAGILSLFVYATSYLSYLCFIDGEWFGLFIFGTMTLMITVFLILIMWAAYLDDKERN